MDMHIKTEKEISAMREGGKILAGILQGLKAKTQVGVSPKDMAQIAAREIKSNGAEPVFLGYQGYPDVICISVNEQVQHAIPNDRLFEAGDVVNYDLGIKYKGMITDAGISVCVGDISSSDARRLLRGTEEALLAGIGVAKDGCYVGDISEAIESVLKRYGLGIVVELVGHGVGHKLHEDIEVPNLGKKGVGPKLNSGMTIAVEPIATLGSPAIEDMGDGWTLVTKDKSWAAQFEHTILIKPGGAEILTLP